jgi:hypothetical protein
MLCLEKSFHSESKLREITTGITDAIEKVIGSSKIIGSGKSTFFIFNLVSIKMRRKFCPYVGRDRYIDPLPHLEGQNSLLHCNFLATFF